MGHMTEREHERMIDTLYYNTNKVCRKCVNCIIQIDEPYIYCTIHQNKDLTRGLYEECEDEDHYILGGQNGKA